MGTVRADTDQQVTGLLVLQTGQDRAALYSADGKAREVIIAARIHAGHFSRLAADQGCSSLLAAFCDAFDHSGRGHDVQLAGGEVVEEHQRLGTLGQQVIDAHAHQIDADCVMPSGFNGDLQLGADAVRGRDQQGINKTCRLEIK